MASRKAAATTSNLIKIMVAAGQATPSGSVGPALGQRGIKAMDFCKQFNERTSKIQPGTPLPVRITIGANRTFSFVVKSPPTAFLLKNAAGIEKGSSTAGHATVGQVSLKHVYAIAEMKQKDQSMSHLSLKAICGAIIGSARSMGIKVVH